VTQRLEKLTQTQLDSSGSNYRINIEVWAAPSSRGQRIAIVYKPSDPSIIYLADNPSEITAIGPLRVALYLFLPGMFLVLKSRPNGVDLR
jgi:hypothetical protein